MPYLPANSTILVTGGNGFIGAWVIQSLLLKGFRVRAAVRAISKSAGLQQTFPAHVEDGRLEFVVVEDILKDGAYDRALVDVDGAIHLASPVGSQGANDPEAFLEPAVKGTLEILRGALKLSREGGIGRLKRVVITGSAASIYTPRPLGAEPRVFSELDWNEAVVEEVRDKGKNAEGMAIYRASKVLAEKSAWEFYENHKAEVPWDLVVLNPPFVFGPPIQQDIREVKDLGATMQMWYNLVVAPGDKPRDVLRGTQGWVDVRDLAEAHVRALESEVVGGERVVVSAGSYVFQEWLDTARRLEVFHSAERSLPVGYPDITHGEAVYSVQYDTSKERKLLGIPYRSMEETTRDTLEWVSLRNL